ncbi:AbrB family transcriptional regulator [Loktanella sp. F6476L]|uniref:AbrB family transcriptional regulator n=1 Tax=Loktanella sp. F6476L TaxID=2926405 RepID=UPI001FF21CF2|nr:AbrB family transcriptional regulator [Loktanella sp. F6476L]MCK0118927.1 AbrB family transcriptional regulator [Loktanella sp. F6476L]
MTTYFGSFSAILLTIILAGIGGWLVSLTGIPLAWMIGSMLVTATASLAQLPIRKPVLLLDVVRAAIGLMLGAAFTHELFASLGTWWLTLLFLVLLLGVMFGVGFFALRRIARFAPATAALCAMPGGIAEMVLLSEREGADQAQVAIVHALRISLAILVISLLIGLIVTVEPAAGASTKSTGLSLMDWFWIAICILAGLLARGRLRIPAPIVIVPMLVSAGLHLGGLTTFDIPATITIVIQVFIGINVGGRFAGVSVKGLMAALGAAVLVVTLQIGIAFGGALLVAGTVGANPVGLVLAYSPGGLAEMSIIALSIGGDVAFVGVHHIFRVMLALMLAPLLLSWIIKKPEDG